jgi:hypothetical protein
MMQPTQLSRPELQLLALGVLEACIRQDPRPLLAVLNTTEVSELLLAYVSGMALLTTQARDDGGFDALEQIRRARHRVLRELIG